MTYSFYEQFRLIVSGGDYRRIVIEQGGVIILASLLDTAARDLEGADKRVGADSESPSVGVTSESTALRGQIIVHALYCIVHVIYNRKIAKLFLAGDGLLKIIQLCCSPIEFPFKMRMFALAIQVRISLRRLAIFDVVCSSL